MPCSNWRPFHGENQEAATRWASSVCTRRSGGGGMNRSTISSTKRRASRTFRGGIMIILGLVLLVLGLFLGIQLLYILGAILLVVGVCLSLIHI